MVLVLYVIYRPSRLRLDGSVYHIQHSHHSITYTYFCMNNAICICDLRYTLFCWDQWPRWKVCTVYRIHRVDLEVFHLKQQCAINKVLDFRDTSLLILFTGKWFLCRNTIIIIIVPWCRSLVLLSVDSIDKILINYR